MAFYNSANALAVLSEIEEMITPVMTLITYAVIITETSRRRSKCNSS